MTTGVQISEGKFRNLVIRVEPSIASGAWLKRNYKMGLMRRSLKVPAVRYATQPPTTTATSCLSSRRAATTNETRTTATPTQSPTTGQNTLSSEKTPVRPPRKHVQFPDTASDSQKEGSITMLVPTRVP